ncbi:MAG: trans-sulfuration enzyme family protein [Candidatus Hodarchaeota archaeon]
MVRNTRLSTKAVRVGQEPDPATGAVVIPLHMATTFQQEIIPDKGVSPTKGFEYARTDNPTRKALETSLASLEDGSAAIAFSSGSAATLALIEVLLSRGDHAIIGEDVYGGTKRLFTFSSQKIGFAFDAVDTTAPLALEDALQDNTRLVLLETPSNPLLKITDIRKVAKMCQTVEQALFAVDNTFATPYLQKPLGLGADIVLHSTTKYLGGHSDVVGGALVLSPTRKELEEKFRFYQNAAGAVPSPFDCWLALRGIRTLAVRMKAHSANARFLASKLEKKADIRQIFYPGLKDHPQYTLAQRQMRDFGGMISLDLGDRAEAFQFLKKLQIFTLAESLGGVESLAEHPASMTHASLGNAALRKIGISDGLVRLSVGIEDPNDLLEDCFQALGV